MLATAADRLPGGSGWAYEFKWDGIRALLDASERGVHLWSRRGNEVTVAYPELVAQAAELPDSLLDGEIVAFVDGRPSFEALQSRMHVRGKAEARRLAQHAPVTFVVFDVLRHYGVDLTARPYAERRAVLERWLGDDPAWTLSPSFEDGPATEAAARQHGLEGVVAKQLTSPYRSGARTREWIKLRFVRNGDFAVVGWEAPDESPELLSSLVLARRVDGRFVYAGKVGSGLTGRSAVEVQRRLERQPKPALDDPPPRSPGRVTHWVRPDVVVEVEYTLMTSEGRLRHPVLRRLRADKTVEEVES